MSTDLKLFAVIGNPIKHSLSPLIHNSTISRFKLHAFYTRFLLPHGIDNDFLRQFLFDSHLSGINVTLPFKEIAYQAVDENLGIAKEIGAINTIIKRDNKLIGYNTDAEGFFHCITKYTPKNVLLLGAGGSARSIALILAQHGIQTTIANRSKEKLRFFESLGETITFDDLNTNITYDIVVNATSAGVDGKGLPLDRDVLCRLFCNSKLIFDLMYQQSGCTAFCSVAKDCNKEFLDGKAMLVYQGALAFLYFHNLHTDKLPSIIDSMAQSLSIHLN